VCAAEGFANGVKVCMDIDSLRLGWFGGIVLVVVIPGASQKSFSSGVRNLSSSPT
jgi:hypothetical protein